MPQNKNLTEINLPEGGLGELNGVNDEGKEGVQPSGIKRRGKKRRGGF
jgi:hypothetical protein